MKEPAKHAGIIGGAPHALLRQTPSRAGLVSRISETFGLIHPKPREISAEEAAESHPRRGQDSGAYRSAMNGGITGGFSLLLGGSRGQRR